MRVKVFEAKYCTPLRVEVYMPRMGSAICSFGNVREEDACLAASQQEGTTVNTLQHV